MADDVKLLPCTEFQLYVDRQEENVVDLTERRLAVHMASTRTVRNRMALKTLLADYKAGRAAIAWQAGKPVFYLVSGSA